MVSMELNHQCYRYITVAMESVFGVAVNLFWKDRNSWFSRSWHFGIEWLIKLIKFIMLIITNIHGDSMTTTWIKPQSGECKINVDGAHFSLNGTSACGGLTCDHHIDGQLIKGFFSKVSSSSSLFAEMWACVVAYW
jgi:hypothetical protein